MGEWCDYPGNPYSYERDVRDLTGLPVATRVRDNGTSAKDPADQISYSFLGDPRPCTDHFDYVLFKAPEGQVVIK